MAYTPLKLSDWLAANPNHLEFRGTAAGTPLIYQAKEGAPGLTTDDWYVWDYTPELPDTEQAATNADITPTGRIARVLLNTVPDAPAASDLEIPLGANTDEGLDALDGLSGAYRDAMDANEIFYLGTFLGVGNKSPVYAASVSWSKSINGTFPDPLTSTISVTPSPGTYQDLVVITEAGG